MHRLSQLVCLLTLTTLGSSQLANGSVATMSTDSPVYFANCSLRNPDRQIYEIFPAATSYRSIVSEVGVVEVDQIEKEYGVKLALSDRGHHTLYIVLKKGIPIGFVHARSEVGERGSIELVWALDLEMRVREFRVQRSREKYTETIRSDEFAALLEGNDSFDLGELQRPDGQADLELLGLPPEAQTVANCVLDCGRKTFAVTIVAFETPLSQARLLGTLHQVFPTTASAKRIKDPFAGVAEIEQLETESLLTLRAVDGSGTTVGYLIHSKGEYEFWCGIDVNGVIQYATTVGASDTALARSVDALAGTDLESARALETGELRDLAVMALAIASQHSETQFVRQDTGD